MEALTTSMCMVRGGGWGFRFRYIMVYTKGKIAKRAGLIHDD